MAGNTSFRGQQISAHRAMGEPSSSHKARPRARSCWQKTFSRSRLRCASLNEHVVGNDSRSEKFECSRVPVESPTGRRQIPVFTDSEAYFYRTKCYTSTVRQTSSGTLSVYKSKPFARFAKKSRITDVDLWKTAQRANQGVIDADLG
jgi:hypothetical protein